MRQLLVALMLAGMGPLGAPGSAAAHNELIGSDPADGATVSMLVRPLEPAGQYTIAYQVLSADGHPVRGAVRFTVANPGTGAAAQSQLGASAANPPDTAAQDTAAQPKVASTPVWPWLVGGAALVVACATVALRFSRRG